MASYRPGLRTARRWDHTYSTAVWSSASTFRRAGRAQDGELAQAHGRFRRSANRLGNCPLGHGAELAGCTRLLAGQPGFVRPPDVIGPAEFLSQPDHSRGDVDLAFEHAVTRAGRVGMVQVVPGLAEGQNRKPGDVPGLVAHFEFFLAERVADRVDRPGDVMQERDSHQGRPEERSHRALPRHGPQSADECRREKGDGDQPGEPPGDPQDVRVREPVRAELFLRGDVAVEQPADMREGEALAQRLPVVTEAPWRVRVAFFVAVLVVPAVIGDPGDNRPLDGQAPGDRQRDLEAAYRLE